jgi:hypothetical protein
MAIQDRVHRLETKEEICMKHLAPVTRRSVKKAGSWEDFVCVVATLFNNIIGAFGGSAPISGYIADKCTIKPPENR